MPLYNVELYNVEGGVRISGRHQRTERLAAEGYARRLSPPGSDSRELKVEN